MRAIPFPRSGRARTVRRHVQGVVLIEVMIALLIFMFGVLGLVGLQATVTRATSDSKFRADASYLAGEMVGRLWSDIGNLGSYDSSKCAGTPSCKEWLAKVAAGLPNGVGSVTTDTASGDATITITWSGPDGQTHTYTTHTTVVKA